MKRILILLVGFLITIALNAQIRLTAVNPSTGTVSIKNFGTASVNISTHRLCHLFTYPVISSLTIVTGSTNLMPGATVIVSGVNLNVAASDLGLYLPTGPFTDPNNMLDFVQWGSAGNGREPVAVSKGIWDVGTFITANPPHQYTGDGFQQFGVTFWQTVTGINQDKLSAEITVYPNPVVDELTIATRDVKIATYKIINQLGEVISTKNNLESKKIIKINFSEYDNGIYFLYINTLSGVISKKITVVK